MPSRRRCRHLLFRLRLLLLGGGLLLLQVAEEAFVVFLEFDAKLADHRFMLGLAADLDPDVVAKALDGGLIEVLEEVVGEGFDTGLPFLHKLLDALKLNGYAGVSVVNLL